MTASAVEAKPLGRSTARISLSYLGSTIVLGLKSPAFLMFTIALPLVYYLIFTGLHSNSRINNVSFNDAYMVNMACFGAINAALAGGANIEAELASGWLRQVRLTPLGSTAFIVTRTVSALLFVLPAIVVLYIIGAVRGTVSIPLGSWFASAAVVWLGAVPFILIGLLMGLLFKHETTRPATVAVMTLMALVGGLWIPIQFFPDLVQQVSHALPSYWMATYGQDVLVGNPSSLEGIVVYLIWTVGAGGLVTVLLGRLLASRR